MPHMPPPQPPEGQEGMGGGEEPPALLAPRMPPVVRSLRTFSAPHEGHTVIGGADMGWFSSNWWPQDGQWERPFEMLS